MDRLSAIKVFVAIAECGSLTAASERLGMKLATVSRQLTLLENALDARLVTRTTRRLSLTEHGRDYLETCRSVIEQLDGAERKLAGEQAEPRGELSITAPVLFGRLYVLPILSDYLRANPRVSGRLLLVDRVVDLLEEGLDVAVRIDNLPDSSMLATRLGEIRLIACASPTYLAARGSPKSPSDLAAHDCISFTNLSQAERWSFGGGKRPIRVTVQPRLLVNTAEAAIDAASSGLGIVRVLSYQARAAIEKGALQPVLVDFEPGPISINLIHREDRHPQAKVQSFTAFAVPRLRGSLKDRLAIIKTRTKRRSA